MQCSTEEVEDKQSKVVKLYLFAQESIASAYTDISEIQEIESNNILTVAEVHLQSSSLLPIQYDFKTAAEINTENKHSHTLVIENQVFRLSFLTTFRILKSYIPLIQILPNATYIQLRQKNAIKSQIIVNGLFKNY